MLTYTRYYPTNGHPQDKQTRPPTHAQDTQTLPSTDTDYIRYVS